MSNDDRRRIAKHIPRLVERARAEHLDPVALFSSAARAFQADPNLIAKGMQRRLPLFLAQLDDQWFERAVAPLRHGRAPVSSHADFAEMAREQAAEIASGNPAYAWLRDKPQRGMPPVSERFDAPDPDWLTRDVPKPPAETLAALARMKGGVIATQVDRTADDDEPAARAAS